MTAPTMPGHLSALQSALDAAEQEWDRVDAHGDAAATARIRITVEPRIRRLRRAIAVVERDRASVAGVLPSTLGSS